MFVIDYFNWALMGDLTFDPAQFPDPKGMVEHLRANNTEIMVSTWPFSSNGSATHDGLVDQGLAVFTGPDNHNSVAWDDSVCVQNCVLYDPSNPETRKFWWQYVKKGYADYGIKVKNMITASIRSDSP